MKEANMRFVCQEPTCGAWDVGKQGVSRKEFEQHLSRQHPGCKGQTRRVIYSVLETRDHLPLSTDALAPTITSSNLDTLSQVNGRIGPPATSLSGQNAEDSVLSPFQHGNTLSRVSHPTDRYNTLSVEEGLPDKPKLICAGREGAKRRVMILDLIRKDTNPGPQISAFPVGFTMSQYGQDVLK